ncbi:MAG: hypothetical protein LBL79_13910 [Prevotella sp.]|jgi:hypothetical protein|nr:hypothetical protein [Prevotella sp.]
MNKVKIMMSVKYYKLMSYVLFCMVLLNTSCRDNIIDNREGPIVVEGDDLVPVLLNLKGLFGEENGMPTYSLTDVGDQEGTGFENTITDVTVFVFNSSNVCEKILQGSAPTYNPIGPELVKTGSKTFIAVVNGVTNLPSPYDTYIPGNEAQVSYNGLRQMLSNTITAPPVAPFLMTGETPATLSVKAISAPEDVTLEVKRAVAKVKFYVTKSLKASGHAITMQKITLHNGADKVCLLQQPMNSTVSYTVSSVPKTVFTPNGNVPLNGTGNYCQLLDTFYTYESLAGSDKSKAVYFELEAAVNSPTNIRKARVYLAENPITATNDTLYDVYRNYWYNVYVNITDPGMDSLYVTINACPWNLADTQRVYVGGGYEILETAQPFKLVKNYTAAEISLHPEIAAIEDHSKGASWIDFMVTDQYTWKLEFTGGGPENVDAMMKADNGPWLPSIEGTGDDAVHRVYIYRPYVENAEPKSGPIFSLTINDTTRVRDFVVQPRDTTPIPTNCFILRPKLTGVPFNETHVYIPLKGVYRYWEDYLLNNGDTIPAGNVTAQLLWQDRPTPNVVVNNLKIINASNRDDSYLYAEAGPVQGNAVVAMQVGGVTYWSFHLWVTEYNPYEAAGQKLYGVSGKNRVFMDRNLGALSNKYDSEGEVRGLFYQFGRKDPFPRTTDWNNEMSTGSNFMWWSSGAHFGPILTGSPIASSLFRPLEAIPYSLKNPTTFIEPVGNWPLFVEDSCLWSTTGGNKTAFDPCPEGWRVPRQVDINFDSSPWNGLDNSNLGIVAGQMGRSHVFAGYYPFAGYLGENARISNAGVDAFFWTSLRVSGGIGLSINNNTSVTLTSPMKESRGVSVRCVVDRNYLINTSGGGLFGGGSGGGGLDEDII